MMAVTDMMKVLTLFWIHLMMGATICYFGSGDASQTTSCNASQETNVRLVDRYDNDLWSEGFVLVNINGTWGTICNVAWSRVDAEVTCFELGFSGAVLLDYNSYKPHPENILYGVRCVGNETTILDCPSSDVDEGGDCWTSAKAYSFCTNYTIRLTGAHFPGGGRVEVFYLGSWRPVCSDHWDLSDGHVACRELGLGTALDVDYGFISSEEMGDYILNDVRCNGSESRILDCPGSLFSIGKCNSTRSARVRCSGGVRLVGGRNSSEGRVEFFSKSTWGTVCAEPWTLNDAHVVCKNLGFAGALKAFTDLEFGFGSGNVYLEDVRCTGREKNILNCPNAQFGVIDFCIFDGAGVLCSSEDENIYLADGTSFLDGVVMYYYNGQQRSVCRDSWDMADAHVVCRSLELGHAVMLPNSHISDGSRDEVTLDCVHCSGNESSFFDCPGVGIASEGNCNDSRDARVMCSGGNVCLTSWCNFGMNSQEGDCHSLIQRTNDSDSGTCVQYEVEDPMPKLSALKCLTPTEIELFGPLFGQILQCQKERKNIYLASHSISSLEQQTFSGMDSLRVLLLANNTIEHIPEGAFDGLQNLEFLDLSFNRIQSIPPKILNNMPRLKTLNIGNNNIIRVHSGAFHGLPSLENLYLDHNNITEIPDDVFSGNLFVLWIDNNNLRELHYGALRGLSSIRRLYLENNHIQKIDNGSFDGLHIQRIALENNNLVTINGMLHGLPELVKLNLSYNNIKHIGNEDFKDQTSLIILDLSNNPITHINPDVFDYAISLEYMLLLDIDLQSIHEDVLTGLTSLKAMSTSDNRLCCLLDQTENVTCARTTSTSPLDTCGRLFPSVVLRIAGWIIGLCSLIGNIVVLVLRFRHETKLSVQTLLIMNLAVADCLMGIYMIIITSADFHFGNSYFLSAPIWRESYLCKFSSFLAFLSSESSVFTLALMTVDRLICIKFPFGRYRLDIKSTATVITVLWLLICTLSLIPLVVPADLPGFYGLSDVCIGLPLHAESKETGLLQFVGGTSSINNEFSAEYIVTNRTVRPSWLYAIVTFIGVNMVLFIFILVCYVVMFIEVKKSTKSVGNATIRNREIKVARKMALIVGTDFACWMPIIVMGILTQSGLVVLPTSLYAWSVIFIIPINSSINPILYTFANYMEGRKKPKKNTPNSEGGGTKERSATISNTSLTQVGSDDHKMNEIKTIKTVTGSKM